MKIAINWEYQDKIDRRFMGHFNGSFTNEDLSISKFIEAVRNGRAYTSWHKNYRRRENFICSQFCALDLDTEDERSTFERLIQDDFISEYATFLHTTPSHTEDSPRCRVVFVLDEPVYDKDKMSTLLKSLLYRYPLSDKACKDVSRFFYGFSGCQTLYLNNILPLEVAEQELVKPFLDTEDDNQEQKEFVGPGEIPDTLLSLITNRMIQHILEAPHGQKHNTLVKMSYSFGGLIAGGYVEERKARRWLREAISSRKVKDKQAAFRAIDKALRNGKNDPSFLYRENGNVFTSDSIINPVHTAVGQASTNVEHGYQFLLGG